MKRVLIISYYWPPAGGISVLRILKFVKYLRRFGWEPVVCVPEGADYIYEDHNNFKDIPDNITILKTKIIEPFKAFKLLSGRKESDTNNPVYGNNAKKSFIDNFAIWIRGNFFIPDARSMWIKPTVKFLSKYIEENNIDAILTYGPPHTNTMIGQKLAEKHKIPWIAEFMDPWTQVDYYKLLKISKWADKRHQKMEQKVFKTAAKITIASPTWAKDLEAIGAKNVEVIYYGYDEDDFKDLKKQEHSDFVISHTGILGKDRKPDVLFKVLKDLKYEFPGFKEKLKIKFAGPVEQCVKDSIISNGLKENYFELGNIPRKEALTLNLSSQILILPINKADNAKGRIPGKLYEYLRAKVPILCFGPTDGDVAKILKDTNVGITLPYNNYEKIKQFIIDIFTNKESLRIDFNTSIFTNEYQIKRIANFLDEVSCNSQNIIK